MKNNILNNKIYLIILIIFILFFILDWITLNRLLLFFLILLIIKIYKIFIYYIELTNYKIKNTKILNFLIFFNKWKNPILILLLKIDEIIFDIISNNNNKFYNIIIYLILILIINPIKILHHKFYNILWLWKYNNIYTILFNRMFGLILSILIFTNILNYIKYTLGISIWLIIYIYILLISISTEFIEDRTKNKWLKIISINNINTINIVYNKLDVSIISWILKSNQINEKINYIISSKIHKIEKFKIGHTWHILNLIFYLKNKPSFDLYFSIRHLLYIYLSRIDEYIYFDYYNWNFENIPNIDIINIKNNKDLVNLKILFDYDYKVFKILLFLMWDIEFLLDYNIKDSLKIDNNDIIFLSLILNNELIFEKLYFELIKNKKGDEFWNDYNIFNKIKFYDIYTKSYDHKYNIEYKNNKIVNTYNKYKNIISNSNLSLLIEINYEDKKIIDISVYHKHIELLYNDWYNELCLNKTHKYKDKLDKLNDFFNLLKEMN
jgi:hypothetical protein